jgi:hypothetical protein
VKINIKKSKNCVALSYFEHAFDVHVVLLCRPRGGRLIIGCKLIFTCRAATLFIYSFSHSRGIVPASTWRFALM